LTPAQVEGVLDQLSAAVSLPRILVSSERDIVAKVGNGHLARNNRIGTNKLLNQHCASALELESILLTWTRKILLQQYQRESGQYQAVIMRCCSLEI